MSAPENKRQHLRYPPEIIEHAVWLYYRFGFSHRDTEDVPPERGIVISNKAV